MIHHPAHANKFEAQANGEGKSQYCKLHLKHMDFKWTSGDLGFKLTKLHQLPLAIQPPQKSEGNVVSEIAKYWYKSQVDKDLGAI